MLGVSPNTLRSWERRFGYPTPRRTAGGHRQFDLAEIEALRQAFEETHNVSSAISIARERGSGPSSPTRLRSALRRFEELEADRILEESLAVGGGGGAGGGGGGGRVSGGGSGEAAAAARGSSATHPSAEPR